MVQRPPTIPIIFPETLHWPLSLPEVVPLPSTKCPYKTSKSSETWLLEALLLRVSEECSMLPPHQTPARGQTVKPSSMHDLEAHAELSHLMFTNQPTKTSVPQKHFFPFPLLPSPTTRPLTHRQTEQLVPLQIIYFSQLSFICRFLYLSFQLLSLKKKSLEFQLICIQVALEER